MGIEVTCPKCGQIWHVPTKAQTQRSKCWTCGTVVTVGPHEKRVRKRKDTSTGETVYTTRDTPVDTDANGLLAGLIFVAVVCALIGFFWQEILTFMLVVVGVSVVAAFLGLVLMGKK